MNLREHCLRNVAGALRDIARLDAFNGPLEDRTFHLSAADIQFGRQHLHPPSLHVSVGLDASLLKFGGDQVLPPGDPADSAVAQEIHGGYFTPPTTGRQLIQFPAAKPYIVGFTKRNGPAALQRPGPEHEG